MAAVGGAILVPDKLWKLAVSTASAVAFGLACWGMLVSRFVPSATGETVAVAAAGVLGASGIVVSLCSPTLRSGSAGYAKLVARDPEMVSPWHRALIFGLVGVVLGFLSVQTGALEFWTLAFGRPGQTVMHVTEYHGYSRRQCSGYDLKEAPFILHRIICVRFRYDEAPPEGSPIILSGSVSPFGIDATAFQLPAGGPMAAGSL